VAADVRFRFDYSGVTAARGAPGERIGAPALARAVRAARAALRLLDGRRRRGEIGFPDLPYFVRDARAIARHAAALAGRFEGLLVLGIGGSALGARALLDALGGERRGLRVTVADNVDPDLFLPLLDSLPLARTLVVAISKSGGTAETNAQLALVAEVLRRARGDGWRENLVVITDPDRGPLRRLASAEGLVSYAVPPNVGGRFSVLSPVGLFPLAAAGISPTRLLAGARWMDGVLRAGGAANPVLRAAAVYSHYLTEDPRPVHVWFGYGAGLGAVGEWWQQLWGESLGKRRPDGSSVGQTPVRAVGVTDQHSQLQLYQDGPADKVYTFVTWARFFHDRRIPLEGPGAAGFLAGRPLGRLFRSEYQGTVAALRRAGRPVVTLEVGRRDEEHLGALLYFWQWVTAIVGTCAGIDPFDQPGVEAGKAITRALLEGRGAAASPQATGGPQRGGAVVVGGAVPPAPKTGRGRR